MYSKDTLIYVKFVSKELMTQFHRTILPPFQYNICTNVALKLLFNIRRVELSVYFENHLKYTTEFSIS